MRAARERRNMTLAALAAAIKVSPRKLDALERDAFDELPDMTFARALAQSVCRQLHIDTKPVLALLPAAPAWANSRFEQVARGSRTPLAAGRGADTRSRGGLRPVFWLAVVLLLGAAALLYGRPDELARWWASVMPEPTAAAPAPTAAPLAAKATGLAPPAAASAVPVDAPRSAGSAPAEAVPTSPATVIETVHSAPTGAAAAASDAEPAGALVLRANGESWVEVRDASGQLLLSRTLLAGEAVGLDGATPLRAVIGNAVATSVSFRGAAIDLADATRDNIARLELK